MSNLKFINDTILSNMADTIRERAGENAVSIGNHYDDIWSPNSMDNNIYVEDMPKIINSMNFGHDVSLGRYSGTLHVGTIYSGNDPANMRNVFNGKDGVYFATGVPIVGYKVTDIQDCFRNTKTFFGDAMCGDNVVFAERAYMDCLNLNGSPAIGNNVTNASNMYKGCVNLTGNPLIGANVVNMSNCYAECHSLDGVTTQKISRGESVLDVYCGLNLSNIRMAFFNCYNLKGGALDFDFVNYFLDNSMIPYPNLTDMYRSFYECQNLDGNLYVGPNVSNLIETFYNCSNLKGSPMSSNLAASMAQTYYNCQGLTGAPKVGPLVANMLNCYYNCTNISGVPVINNNVTIATGAYYNCQNLTGTPVIGLKVTTLADTFHNCRNMTGTADIPTTTTNLVNAFRNCTNLDGVVIRSNPTAAMMAGAFVRDEFNHRLKVILPTRAAFNNAKGANPTGCTMGDVIVDNVNVKVAYTYTNGYIYGYKTYEAKAYCYNEECNLYIFSLA